MPPINPLPLDRLPLELLELVLENLLREETAVDVSLFMGPESVPSQYNIKRLYTRGTDYPVLFEKDDCLRLVAAQAWLKSNTFSINSDGGVRLLEYILATIPKGYQCLRRLVYRGAPRSSSSDSDNAEHYHLFPGPLIQKCTNLQFLSLAIPEFVLNYHGFEADRHDGAAFGDGDEDDPISPEGEKIGGEMFDIAEDIFSKSMHDPVVGYDIGSHPKLERIETRLVMDVSEEVGTVQAEDRLWGDYFTIGDFVGYYLQSVFEKHGRTIDVTWIEDAMVHGLRWIFARPPMW